MNNQIYVNKLRAMFNSKNSDIAIIDSQDDRRYTYSELTTIIEINSQWLSSNYSKQILVSRTSNSCSDIILMLVCWNLGRTFFPLDHNLQKDEVNRILGELKDYDYLEDHFCVTNQVNMLSHSAIFSKLFDNTNVMISSTSGTTGEIKLIPIEFQNIYRGLESLLLAYKIDYKITTVTIMPFAYQGGWLDHVLKAFLTGGTVIATEVFDGITSKKHLKYFETEKVNYLHINPAIATVLIFLQERSDQKILPYLRCLGLGFSPIDLDSKIKLSRLFGDSVFQEFGISETFYISAEGPSDTSKPKSVGKIIEGNSIKILKDEELISQPDTIGELLIKTPYMFQSYLNNEDNAFIDGYFCTGDIGYFDSDGYVYIIGRIKDIIKKAGYSIHPLEVEKVILNFPGILECCVFKVVGANLQEKIGAAVISNLQIDVSKLKKFCEENLTQSKVPDFFYFLSEIPKNPSGKFLRKVLTSKYSS